MITHVAIWRNNTIYALEKPNRHHHLIHTLMPKKDRYEDGDWDIQGFLDEHNRFLGRREAYIYAKKIGQIARKEGKEFYQGDQLFSEDLW